MTKEHVELLRFWASEAEKAGHPFPEAAACEAALESAYGLSYLAVHAKNLFGMKQHKKPVFGTHVIKTREFIEGRGFVVVDAAFVEYPTLADCFADRVATLKRLADDKDFVRYKFALMAKTPEEFVEQVSKKWSTDPNRAKKVLEVYEAFKEATKEVPNEHAA